MYQFKTEPLPEQRKGFDKLKDLQFFALLCDRGTGKTKQSIDIMGYKHSVMDLDRVVVFAPSLVTNQWTDEELPKHCGVAYSAYTYAGTDSKKKRKALDSWIFSCYDNPALCVLSVNYEALRTEAGRAIVRQFLKTSKMNVGFFCDESSRIKNPSTKTVKELRKIVKSYPKSIRAILTGTPATKGPVNLWSMYEFLQVGFMKCSYVAFKREHTIIIKKKMQVKKRLITIEEDIDLTTYNAVRRLANKKLNGGPGDDLAIRGLRERFGLSLPDFYRVIGADKHQRFKNLDRLRKYIEPITHFMDKSSLSLPVKIKKTIPVPLNKTQKKLIEDLKKYSVTMWEDRTLTMEHKVVLGTRILQICGGHMPFDTEQDGVYGIEKITGKNHKLEWIKDDLNDIGNHQFIVWAVFIPEIHLLFSELRKNFAVGVISDNDALGSSEKAVEQFKKGDLQGLVANPVKGAYGLNLQAAGIQYWYSRNFRTETRLQGEDRSHRYGIKESPIYYDVLCDIKFEYRVLDILNEEGEINELFLQNPFN